MENSSWGDVGIGALLVALGGVIATIIGAVTKAMIDYKKTAHEQYQQRHGGTIEEYRDLTEQYAKAYNDSREEVHGLRDELYEAQMKLSLCQADLARAVERITSLEELIERHTDLKFRRWKLDDSSSSIDTSR